jgi:hypothetical protein
MSALERLYVAKSQQGACSSGSQEFAERNYELRNSFARNVMGEQRQQR